MHTDNIFTHILANIERDDINEILFNWNESELNEEGTEILIYVDSRAYGPKSGGANVVDKKEFLDWIFSDKPFDPEVYGKDIQKDEHWFDLIEKVRRASTINI